MEPLFVYGTLCHLPLLRVVLGRDVAAHPATAAGYGVHWARGQEFPLIVPKAGAVAQGLLLEGLDAQDLARLDWYEGAFGYGLNPVSVAVEGRADQAARVYMTDRAEWQPAELWSLADWVARCGATVVATAGDAMARYPAGDLAGRWGAMLVRGSSRVRARQVAPTTLRHAAQPQDMAVAGVRQPYADFFAVEEYDLSFRRFDGGQSPVVTRAVFVSGDAVTVLPYDPVRDRVLVIEQFRIAPHARGDSQPWVLEAIAGRIDPFESPEIAARREAEEEAGLVLGDLLAVAAYYPSAGAKSEFVYSYVAITDLRDGAAGIGGVASEDEDIRGHLLDFSDFMALVDSGEVASAPLILTAFWLQRERARLRASA
ncbi:MAG: gamma-glutamylcyclotransferase [Paracoccaceae bacterium]|nr:gamma-glutamylcyclotransferase [Paracoccaceae bacterium]